MWKIRSAFKTLKNLSEHEEFYRLFEDITTKVKGIELLSNEDRPESNMILLNFQEKQKSDCPFGNVLLSAFTTAHARLHL